MRLAVVSHKLCWPSANSPTGYATDGGFAFQMAAISELFDSTTLIVPSLPVGKSDSEGEIAIRGHQMSVVPLDNPHGVDARRKLAMLAWFPRNGFIILREILKADAIHAPVPSDVGTIGMLLAYLLRKPLFVRHCGNWLEQTTTAQRFWRWFMERTAGGRNVMLATGGTGQPPSAKNPNIEWIFSTSLTEQELKAYRTERQPISGRAPKLVIACRQEKLKGTEVVLRSLAQLRDAFPNITLDVAGEGSYLPYLKSLAAELGLDQQVIFHGQVTHEEVMHLLQQADLFCYPTRASEGFPKVILEALACGLPVITTRVSVLPQLIGDHSGILLDEGTPEALTEAVKRLLGDEASYLSASCCALETAQTFSLESWRDRIGARLHSAWGITASRQ